MKQYSHIVFAGAFDRLHIGHKKLLDKAFKLAEKVSIGITTENLYKSKPLANLIQTWQVRRGAVEQYLRERNWLKGARFFRLDDIYGPSIVDKTMDSILVTELTSPNAEKINKIRVKNGLPSMKIIVAPLVRGDDGEVVTSERIRLGEIDKNGKSYWLFVNSYLKKQKKELVLPKYLRKELRKPLGKLIGGAENQLEQTARKAYRYIDITICPMVITVGDIVTMSLLRIGFDPDVKIIDLRSRRKDINLIDSSTQFFITREPHPAIGGVPSKVKKNAFDSSKYLNKQVSKNFTLSSHFINEPGSINLNTANEIKKSIVRFIKTGEKQLIVVKGEEDLLALPAILMAPLHSIVLYGQIDLGIVMIEVTEEKKREVERILKKFD